jgi:hypothetical protein
MTDEKQQVVDKVEEILSPYFTHDDWSGGLRRFSDVPWETMETALLAAGDLTDYQLWNGFIGTLALIKEAGKLEEQGFEVKYHGYLVGNGRQDSRLTLEGLIAYSEDHYKRMLASSRGVQLGADEFEDRGDSVLWWWD